MIQKHLTMTQFNYMETQSNLRKTAAAARTPMIFAPDVLPMRQATKWEPQGAVAKNGQPSIW